MTKRERREINRVRPDLDQLKAMAHPARLAMLGRLRADGPATASSLALQMGLNSGATSYHLRQLADVGLIEEDTTRGNKRDRWWKATHESTATEPSQRTDAEENAVLGAYHAVVAHQAAQQIEQAAAEIGDLPKEWSDLVGASDYNVYLTPEQVRRVKDAVHAVLQDVAETSRDPQQAPDGAAPVVFQFHTFPRPGALAHRDEAQDFES